MLKERRDGSLYYDWADDCRRSAKEYREEAAQLLKKAETSEKRAEEIEKEESER